MYINIEQYYKTIIRFELSYDTGRLVLAYGPTCLGPRANSYMFQALIGELVV
jgi:hypothetical protein